MSRALVLVLFALLSVSTPAIAEGAGQPALADLVAAHRSRPDDAGATRALEASVSAGLPPQLSAGWLPTLPVDASPLPYDLGTLVVPKAYLPTHATEPQHGWLFVKVAYVYLPGDPARLLCAVHYPDAAGQALAIRIAKLLALAHQTLVQRTGREAENGTAPFDVWLCAGGRSGGEQWRSNLYLYDLDQPRSSIEWLREVVHEYSHLALPAIGGYTAPEYWANGYLGERLLVRWFMRPPDGPARVEALWGDFSGAANFRRLLITPPLALYARIGPSPVWLARRDDAGMRYLIGQALTFDDRYGAARLGDAFARLPRFHQATAQDFAAALARTLGTKTRAVDAQTGP